MKEIHHESNLYEKLLTLSLAEVKKLRERSAKSRKREPPAPAPGQRGSRLPLSFFQQRLWFTHQYLPDQQTTYNIPWALEIVGPLDVAVLRKAFAVMIGRHEILRTSFHLPEGQDEPVQSIADDLTIEIPLIDVVAEQVQQYAREHAGHVFDLTQLPLLKVAVLRLQAQKHLLLINMHHIISDGWSISIMSRELTQAYRALRQGEPVDLPALPLQYADYACWQRELDLQPHLQYWQQTLTGYEEGMSLPYDHARPATRAWRAGYFRHRYPDTFARQLSDFSNTHHVTLFMSLLAGFAAVLHQYTGRRDLVIGTTTAGRERAELEPLIGFFVNILPLRIDLADDPTGRELIERVRMVAVNGLEHQALPFEHLLNALHLQRDPSQPPLVPVMLRHQNMPPAPFELSDELQLRPVYLDDRRATSELDLQFFGDKQRLEIVVEYALNLFEPSTVERLLKQHERLLQEMMSDPQRRLSQFSLLDEAEARQILIEWNRTERALEADLSVAALFELQVQRTSEAVACCDSTGHLSYGKLNARANQIAHYLRAQAIGPDTRVGLCLDRSCNFLAALLGIFKIGATYVPLDPGYPGSYLQQILADAEPQLVLTSADLMEHLPLEVKTICLQDALLADQASSNPGIVVRPEQAAYVAYTSGSTGRPKGVVVPHRQILNWLHALWARIPLESGEVIAQKTSSAFVVSVKELLSGLLAGARVAFVQDDVLRDIPRLIETLSRDKVSRLHIVPSHLRTLLEGLDPDVERLRSLKHCITAGEPLAAQLLEQLKARLPWVRLWNNYGCTELNDVTYAQPREQVSDDHLVPIGRPIDNTRVYVLDKMLSPVPLGVVGELCVSSIGMAYGYWRQPSRTAERFVPDPFSLCPGARLYKTGDLVRFRSTGELEYIGRADSDVKIRGNRVDVRQIECVLAEYPGIQQAVVQGWSTAAASIHLAAYYLMRPGEVPPARQVLREYLMDRLPAYMVPSFYHAMETLPRLPNGKLDRRGLPAPDQSDLFTTKYIAPSSAIEQRLVQIWAELLALPAERIGIHDDFFVLGGHSLLAVRLMVQIRKVFQIELPIRTVFDAPTVVALGSEVHEMASQGAGICPRWTCPRERLRPEAVPLSLPQRRLWFTQRNRPDQQTTYNMPWALEMVGPLDVAALRRAFAVMIGRHEILRTSFHLAEGRDEPVQSIADDLTIEIPLIDVTPEQARQYAREHARHVFDLSQLPLLKVAVLRLQAQKHLLLVNMHHIISDGWSISVMSRELTQAYRALRQEEVMDLPALPLQYADYACWQRELDLQPHLQYWQQTLTGYEEGISLPYDHARPATRAWRAGYFRHRYPDTFARQLSDFSNTHHVTLFMSLLAGFAAVLHQYTGRRDLVIGTTTAGRERAELEPLIGFFVNILPLRIDLADDPTGRELIERVRTVVINALEHQLVPLERLIGSLNIDGDPKNSSFLAVVCRHQNLPSAPFDFCGDLQIRPVHFSDDRGRIDELDLQFYGGEGGLELIVDYAADLLEASTIKRLTEAHERIMEGMISNPDLKLSDLLGMRPANHDHM